MATFGGLSLSSARFAVKGNQSANLAIARALPNRLLVFTTHSAQAGARHTQGAPLSEISQSFNGTLSGSLALNFYNRLWLDPSKLELGNLVSAQQFPVSLWNAYFNPRSLASIQADNAEGITLDGQPAPLLLKPLQEVIWQLQAGLEGAPVIDGGFTFQVTGEIPLLLQISGQRIIAFAFAPNWQRGMVESLEWQTEILSSESGHEQRRALRDTPRRSVQADFFIEGSERRRLEPLLSAWGGRTWALPTWTDAQYLAAHLPTGSAFIPCEPHGFSGLALLKQSSTLFEVVEIAQVTASGLQLKRDTAQDWPASTQLLPLRRAFLQRPPAMKRKTDSLWQLEAQFLQKEPEIIEPANLPLYRNLPVLEQAPEESEDLTLAFERITKLLDNQTAPPLLIDHGARSFYSVSHGFLCADRNERRALLAMLYALEGRQKPLWLPTFADDLMLAATMAANAFNLDIESVDMARFFKPRDIRIELADGTKIYRRVLSASALTDSTERLALNQPAGITLEPQDIKRISYLNLVRQDTDLITLRHLTDSVTQSKTVFKEVRDEL